MRDAAERHVPAVYTQEIQASTWSGPLPSPEVLERFDSIVPGAAERVFKAFELQGDHRRAMESELLTAQIADANAARRMQLRGQWFALVIGVMGLAGAVLLALYDHDVVAGTIGTATIASLAAAFIHGRRKPGGESQQADDEAADEADTA